MAIIYSVKRGDCRHFDGKTFVHLPCKTRRYVAASGRARWHVTLPRAIAGPVAVFARATDRAGNTSAIRKRFAAVKR